jgi:sensor histidine kinase YesM
LILKWQKPNRIESFRDVVTHTSHFITHTSWICYTYITHSLSSKKTYLLYSQQVNLIISKDFARFTKLIKRFRFLQVWFKSSDNWRWLSSLKWELFETFSKVEIVMFFDKRALNTSLLIFFSLFTLLTYLFFLVLVRRWTLKFQRLRKALISELIIDVTYYSIWVILAEIESVLSTK